MNVMCFVLSLAAVITWLAQFFMRLRKNVLIREDIANGGWNSEGEATMGYSFWLVFIASIGKAEQQSSLDMTDFSSVMKLLCSNTPILLKFLSNFDSAGKEIISSSKCFL